MILSKNKKPVEKKEEKKEEPVKAELPNDGEDMWSEEQQKALEGALKQYPSSLPANDRWTSISKEVPGKTKKQCVERYKFLSQFVKKNK